MKRHLEISLLLLCLSIFGRFQKANAEVGEFSEKINGDIYGQVKVIDDVDGDGNKDMIFGATDGRVHIYSSNGKEIFRPPFWPKQVNGPVTAGIEVSDLDGNGHKNIIVSTMSGTVYCLNSKGKELWKYDTGGDNFHSTPLVTSLGGDGKQKIILTSGSGKVVILASDGYLEQEMRFNNPVRSNPVVADLTGNGEKSIIVKDNSGKISIFDQGGTVAQEWDSAAYRDGVWPFNFDVSDTNGDGIPEIFSTDPTNSGGLFQMWDIDGKLLSSFELSDASHGAPKVADIDGDGIDDFVIAQSDGTILVCDKDGKAKKGWPFKTSYSIYSAPSLIDLDGDGTMEIVFTGNDGNAKDLSAGCVIALNKEGEMLEEFPKFIGKTMAPLTFADLDGNGTLEIIAAGGIGYSGPQLHVLKTKAKQKFKIVTLRQQTTVK